MVSVKREITEEEYKKALEEGPRSIVSESVIQGYGCYGATVSEHDGKFYLSYERGESCD